MPLTTRWSRRTYDPWSCVAGVRGSSRTLCPLRSAGSKTARRKFGTLIHIRVGDKSDNDRVNAFYSAEGRSARVSATERFVLAEDEHRLIGVIRLCLEGGHAILRTMRVISEGYRGQGIGKRMLGAFEGLVSERDCYCLPFAHLTGFYGRIGFKTIPIEQAPPHLQERYKKYRDEGADMLVMKRAANWTGRAAQRETLGGQHRSQTVKTFVAQTADQWQQMARRAPRLRVRSVAHLL